MLKTAPAVFAVGDHYEIMVPVKGHCLFWVQVGDNTYYDASCGVMRSLCRVHRVSVPMNVLDEAKSYTVCYKPVLDRRPYFTKTADTQQKTFSFSPVPAASARAYHIADAHNHIRGPVKAARVFGKIDFLILNGDLLDFTAHPGKYENIYKLCDAITGGHIPVVFSRGNHDMRGKYAESFTEFAPNDDGRTYYTFQLGSIGGVVLDCGEDKEDSCAEYGHTISCHSYRQQQTEFLRKIVEKQDFLAPGITTRLVICHVPFTQKDMPPFDIEQELYRQWAALLAQIKPDLMICGHTHVAQLRQPGCKEDDYGQPCPVVVASGYDDKSLVTGCGFIFKEDEIEMIFTDSAGNMANREIIKK